MSTPTLENDDQNKENDLFYLVKDISKNSIGLKDSEGNPVAFFDEKDKGVIQSTALLQKLNNSEFTLGSSGSVNSGWYSFLQAGTHTYEDTTGWNPSTFIINWITTTTATDDIGKCRELEVNWATSILNSWEATASKRQGRGIATATFGEIFFLTIKNQLLIANSSLSNLTDFNALKIYIEGILSGSNDHSALPGSAGRSTIPIKEYFKYFNISDGTQFENPGELSDFVTIINSIYGDTLSDQLDVQRNNLSSFQSISQSVLSFQNNTEFALGPYLKGEDRITGYQNIETEEIVSELPEGSDVTDYNLLYGNFSVIDELKDRFRKYSEFANVQTLISGVMLNNQLIESKDFQSLIDTPTGYLGHSGDYLIINGNETGVHFTGIEKIASDLIDYGFDGGGGSTNFTGLQDTPTGYIGHSGQYLIVNNNETGVHFTGIEKIASDLIDYGFDSGGGSTNFTGLQDTPNAYSEGDYLRSTSNGLEYITASGLVQDIGDEIVNNIVTGDSLGFTGLNDTPDSYVGQSGQYAIVNNEETTIHFTGIEKIANDLTDYGFNGSLDVPKYTTLPSAIDNNNKIIASGCDLYYSCNGSWKKINAEDIPPPENTPGCVSNLEEYNQYQEYKEEFLAKNSPESFDQMLNFNNDISDSINNVCLFSNNDLSTVIIDETNYKWGIFNGTQTINITATPGVASDREIQFSYWTGDGAVFADANSSQTTLVVDKDLSITGYFIETDKNTYTCTDTALHIQSDTVNNDPTHRDLTGNNTVTASSASSPANTTDQPHLGATSIDFTDNANQLEVGDLATKANFQFLHDRSSSYTIEGWMYRNDDSDTRDVILSNAAFTVNIGIRVRFLSEDKLTFTICRGSDSKSFEATTANAIPYNAWVHYAICWDGANITCYINGSSSAGFTQAWTDPVSTSEPTQILWIGARDGGGIDRFNGYMQDIRISKKVIYSGDFTPPTALIDPCSPDLVELTCEDIALHTQSNTSDSDSVFVDLSDNNHTITPVGDAQHSVTNAYLGSTSMSFDGAGDYLEIGNTSTFKFLHDGSTDYIVECWLRVADLSNNAPNPSRIISTARTTSDIGIDFFVNRNGTLGCWVVGGSEAYKTISLESSSALQSNTWYHIVLQNTVTQDLEIFINGIKQTAQSATINPQQISASDSTSMLLVGELVGFGRPLNGQLQDLRIAKKAIYTSNFTPPNSLLNNLC